MKIWTRGVLSQITENIMEAGQMDNSCPGYEEKGGEQGLEDILKGMFSYHDQHCRSLS